MLQSYGKQSTYFHFNSIKYFLYEQNINLKWVNGLIAFAGYKQEGTKNLDTPYSSKNGSQGQVYFLKEKTF